MKRAILLAGTLFLCFTHIATAQWQFAGVFPDSTTLTNTAHGIGVGGDGSVWVGPYNSTLVPGTPSERFNPVVVYHSDGTPASFSPIKGWMDADTLRRFGPISGISNDAQGNVWVSAHGFRTNVKSRVNPAQDSIIGGFWNQTRSWIYKFAADGTQLMAKEVTIMRTETASHAPNRVAVTSNGDAIVSFVFPGSPIKIYAAADLSEMGTVTLDKSGFSRSLEVSPDGRTVYSPAWTHFLLTQYVSQTGVDGEYVRSPDSTLARGMSIGALLIHPLNPDLLYATAAGGGNDPIAQAPWSSIRTYGLSLSTGLAVDSLQWDYGTRTAFIIPRSLAMSPDGRTLYMGTFSTGIPAVQKFTFQGELPEPPPTIDLQSGLVAYYPFNGNAEDESGNNRDATAIGATTTTDRFGLSNSSYYFNGDGQYLIASGVGLPEKSRTVSLWFNVPTVDNKPNILAYGGTGECGTSWLQGLNHRGEQSYITTSHCSAIESSTPFNEPPINRWIHWVVTTDSTGTKMYLDGQLVSAQTAFFNNTGVQQGDLTFGTSVNFSGMAPYIDNNVGWLEGSLDDIRIYNRALSPAEVAALNELESTPPPLAADEIADIDGNRYKTVRIGDQVWMAENLRTTRYQDGFNIPNRSIPADAAAWSHLNGNSNNEETYGKVYTGHAVFSTRQICPVGWQVSTDDDWKLLERFIGMNDQEVNAGDWRGNVSYKIKSVFPSWIHVEGNNETGFDARPGGGEGVHHPEEFRYGWWWVDGDETNHRVLVGDANHIGRGGLYSLNVGMYVRCIQNSQTASSDTWTLPVRATTQTGLAASAYLGVSPSASDGLDSLDVPAPPTPPGEHITLFTNHPEWNSPLGPRVGSDIRASVDLSAVPTSWDLTLSSSGAATGTLLLDRPDGLNWPIVVLRGSQRWVSRSGDLSVPFSFTAAGQQVFTVQVGDTTAPGLQAGAWFEGPAIVDGSATHPLSWQAGDQNHVQSVALDVSYSDGAAWTEVYSGTAAAFNWTPSQSIVFNESTRFRLTATDRADNVTVIATQTPVSVMAPRQPAARPQGWSLSGSPFVSPNTAASTLGEAFRFAWTGVSYEPVAGFAQGRGHWTGALQAVTDTLAGTVATQAQTLNLPAGWNIIASPLLRSIYVDSVTVTHGAHGRRLPLPAAIDSNWVTAPLGYTGSAYASSGRVEPFAGYWLGVTVPQGASLTLPIHAYATAQAKESSQSEPLVLLKIRDQDAEQMLSIRQGGGVPAPPAAPNGQRIGLKGQPTILGDLYLVGGADPQTESAWPLVIGGEARTIELSWTDQSFAGMTAVLQLTDRRYDLTRASSVTFRSDESAQVIVGPISTSTEPSEQGPLRTELMAAYPNPFNPSTVISFTLGTQDLASVQIRLAVYDVLGRQVAVLVNGNMSAGSHQVTFDAAGLASGVYLVRLEAGGEVFTRRMTLIK